LKKKHYTNNGKKSNGGNWTMPVGQERGVELEGSEIGVVEQGGGVLWTWGN